MRPVGGSRLKHAPAMVAGERGQNMSGRSDHLCVRRAMLAAVVLLAASAPALACHPALPVIRSDRGLTFTADAFAHVTWRERSSGGRVLTYGRQIWRGKIGARTAYLTFDEIPGTSGPNHAMAFRLERLRRPPRWASAGRYDLGERFIIRSGPLGGAWSVANCG